MAVAPMSIRHRRWRASRSWRLPKISGAASQARVLLAAVISLEEIEDEFAGHIAAREDVIFDLQSSYPARARSARRLGAIALNERPMAVPGQTKNPRRNLPRSCNSRPPSSAVDENTHATARPGQFCAPRGRRRMARLV